MGKEQILFRQSTPLQESARNFALHLFDAFRFEVSGVENLNHLSEPSILAFFPHYGHADLPAIRKAVPSNLRKLLVFPEAADYWSTNPFRSQISSLFLPTIPLNRDGAGSVILDDLDTLGGLMSSGYSVVVSPEGTRSELPLEERELRTGTAELALRTHCPVIPVRLYGFEDVMPKGTPLPRLFDRLQRRSVKVVFGSALRFGKEAFSGTRAQTRKATTHVLREVLLRM
ncbi:MAG: hypothetical protein A3F04_01965 [Candidatus Chisholmbacteria bacterium RIFCSPHIGHO2_12_FULL_49_9]|uniref:Phospholipid/glycerol acyltransferase domain-containing protein n=1 Tax=Candidatus Chisholmbacteria bacterium RIFCSPHIGHO2_01_FULL_52_32 TaxID=1797591 RepID=A0A1G1VS00_9BACT|nr:MAG: hypothetical protein A3F04_01965 [Candidatus Chisholmbacteria bacterium RIFCSPHIGHO2_12_FULL_49_9]OGY18176.1 MAG: hypothetical protein A2786_01510 [Candidatus Chisholmbacteria bacterium RIFCSPHIGHO2_01_FULL_52_32]OGY20451.1 MAG: hypothetical protein A2900_05235 [Candidatus Chisholmbacteria bacterium RIFCSPLOWO2_01_FULL_50_28]